MYRMPGKPPLDAGARMSAAFPDWPWLVKTVTFANTVNDVDLFTVTGDVFVRLIAVCETDVESAGGADISIGVTGTLNAIIAVTDCTLLEAGEIWHDNNPDSGVEAMSVIREYIIANGLDIVLDVEAAKQVDSGVVKIYLWWAPISTDGKVVVA